eukprot:jgi/Chrzof1/8416/Cz03g09240.t1
MASWYLKVPGGLAFLLVSAILFSSSTGTRLPGQLSAYADEDSSAVAAGRSLLAATGAPSAPYDTTTTTGAPSASYDTTTTTGAPSLSASNTPAIGGVPSTWSAARQELGSDVLAPVPEGRSTIASIPQTVLAPVPEGMLPPVTAGGPTTSPRHRHRHILQLKSPWSGGLPVYVAAAIAGDVSPAAGDTPATAAAAASPPVAETASSMTTPPRSNFMLVDNLPTGHRHLLHTEDVSLMPPAPATTPGQAPSTINMHIQDKKHHYNHHHHSVGPTAHTPSTASDGATASSVSRHLHQVLVTSPLLTFPGQLNPFAAPPASDILPSEQMAISTTASPPAAEVGP